jgi:hypothetical protein
VGHAHDLLPSHASASLSLNRFWTSDSTWSTIISFTAGIIMAKISTPFRTRTLRMVYRVVILDKHFYEMQTDVWPITASVIIEGTGRGLPITGERAKASIPAQSKNGRWELDSDDHRDLHVNGSGRPTHPSPHAR